MIKMHKHSKLVIILLVFFLSITIGIKVSGLMNIFKSSGDQIIDENIAKNVEKSQYLQKLSVKYSNIDLDEVVAQIKELVSADNVTILNSEKDKDYYHIQLEIKKEDYSSIYDQLLMIKGYESENIINSDSPQLEMDVEEHIKNKELLRSQLKGLITHSTLPDRITKYNTQLEEVQNEIDKLYSQQKLLEKYRNYVMISVLVKRYENKQSELISTLGKFLFYTFATLILISVFLTLLYFILTLFLKFMKVIGIQTSTSTSQYYNRPQKKRVKRKFKDPNSENNL